NTNSGSIHPPYHKPQQHEIITQIRTFTPPIHQLLPRPNFHLHRPLSICLFSYDLPKFLEALNVMHPKLGYIPLPPLFNIGGSRLIPHHDAVFRHQATNLLTCSDLRVPAPLMQQVTHYDNRCLSLQREQFRRGAQDVRENEGYVKLVLVIEELVAQVLVVHDIGGEKMVLRYTVYREAPQFLSEEASHGKQLPGLEALENLRVGRVVWKARVQEACQTSARVGADSEGLL
ncbi:hypothetical protein BU23DRAFT_634344, partial [Bimuria novae-zelandiae CBS 107.79]